jgi:predicted DCC family thiol-disulfide oxidoreductase YuxK
MRRATLLYDEDCGFCRWSADRLRSFDRQGSLEFHPIQGQVGDRLLYAVPPARRRDSWHLVEPDGRVWSGGAAVGPLLDRLPNGRPIAALVRAMPGVTDRTYSVVAARRSSLGRLLGQQACAVDPSRGQNASGAGRAG